MASLIYMMVYVLIVIVTSALMTALTAYIDDSAAK